MFGNMNSESADSSLIAASPVLSRITMDKFLNFPETSFCNCEMLQREDKVGTLQSCCKEK